MTKRKSKGAYMISSVAEMYGIHPQTLRLYEREGLLKPSRTEGNTRLYTDEDLQRLEFILSLARDLGVNISGIAIILQMRERMEEMQLQIQDFVKYIQEEVLSRASAAADPAKGAIVPVRRHMVPSAADQKTIAAVGLPIRPRLRIWIHAPLQTYLQRRLFPAHRRARLPCREISPGPRSLIATGVAEPSDFVTPQVASDQDILLVHTPQYVEKLKTGTLSPREEHGDGNPVLAGVGPCILAGGGRFDSRGEACHSGSCMLSISEVDSITLFPITAKAFA